MSNDPTVKFLDQYALEAILNKIKLIVDEKSDKIDNFTLMSLADIGELPNIGSDKTIYLVQGDEGDVLYRWVPEKLSYTIIGTNYNNIEIIRGGDSNE